MKTGLLTILTAAIAAAFSAGISYASETSNLNSDAAQIAEDPAGVEAGAVEAAGPIEAAKAADATGAVETAGAVEAGQAPAEGAGVDVAEAATAAIDPAAAANAGAATDSSLPDSTDTAAALTESETDTALTESETDTAGEASGEPIEPDRKVALGEIGYDDQGRSGRVHLVVTGDTLWDISDAYLGTPWVWPSVWTDNRDIEDPHLIVPGDRIWITAHEMRRVSAEEAERLLAGKPLLASAEGEEASGPASDSFQSLLRGDDASNSFRVSSLETTGLISAEQLEASASIVDGVPERVMLSQGDLVYIGLGDQQASAGDQFTIFRTQSKVFDPDTNKLLGYYVKLLGWVEVESTDAESSVAVIRMSADEMAIGDRVMPREKPILDVEMIESPKNVDGKISFVPSNRVLTGTADYVYLNRGELDGLQVGSPLEVYRKGWRAPEPARDTRVDVPDRVIAQLLVVRAQSKSAVALIRHSDTELELGDLFRGASD